jgi:hypothetical protein
MSSSQPLLDAAGRRRSPATTPGARAGIAPRVEFPAGPLFCVIDRSDPWACLVSQLHLALKAGVRRRIALHQYAGICVMPMLVRTSCSAVGIGQVGRHNEHPIARSSGAAGG